MSNSLAEKRQAWMKAELKIDAPSQPGGIRMGSGRTAKTPEPTPWVPGEGTKTDTPKGPTIGTSRDLAGGFEKQLREGMGAIESARKMKPGTEKAKTAAEAMETAFGAAVVAAKAKDFRLAGTKLTEALSAATTVGEEREAAKKTFEEALAPKQKALEDGIAALKDVPGVGGDVTRDQEAAQDLVEQAEEAAAGEDWEAANKLIPTLTTAMTTLENTYGTEAAAAGEALGKSAKTLGRRVEALKGTDLASAGRKAEEAQTKATQAQGTANGKAKPEEKLAVLLVAQDEAQRAAREAQGGLNAKANQTTTKALVALRASASDAINAMPEGDAKEALKRKLTEWDGKKTQCDRQTNLTVQATLIKSLSTDVRKLMDDATAGLPPDQAQAKKQLAFKAALEQRFGIVVALPPGGATTHTHLDMYYDMMDLLPVEQTNHSMMKKLQYDMSSSGAGYAPGHGLVQMGKFERDKDWDYKNPVTGATEPMNGFSISTLHEVGHAVDDKYRIMATNGSDPKSGGWKDETADSVAAAFLAKVKAEGGTPLTTRDPAITALFKTALQSGTAPTKPTTVPQGEWDRMVAHLQTATELKSNKWPWGAGKEVELTTGRAYHESYPNTWVSYAKASRSGITVRDYQYRAPAEWFAELYAYTWFKQVKAPSGVNAAVAEYMYPSKG